VEQRLLSALDPGWGAGDPSALVPDHAARRAELEALDPALAELYVRGAEVLAGAADAGALKERLVALLGRERGVLTLALAEVPGLAPEQKKIRGRGLNLAKRWLEELEQARRATLEQAAESREALDVTLPGRRPWVGHAHVLAQIRDELLDLFHGLGYSVATSPEVEHEEYNFTKLNFDPDHPARDAHDTYFVSPEVVLRTHTSPGWVRAMEERRPPLRLVFPGRVYRAEQVDASHMDQFHQMDGLYVAERVTMAELRSTLREAARRLFGHHLKVRFVPLYFPFTEPSAQMDVACILCGGGGRLGGERCPVCKATGWLEILGAGMVHPAVFRAVGYDPDRVTGYAFGIGLERMAMLRYRIPDIRFFLENDLRFLRQF
jgi:phenylalanyl-tRNA synthetase alpha chain